MKKIAPFLLLLFLFSTYLFSQERGFKVVATTSDGKILNLYKGCYALVIGISDYPLSGWPDLPNAVRDADEIGDLFEDLEFKVSRIKNPTKAQFIQELEKFVFGPGQNVDNCLVIFFAGHGHTEKLEYGPDMGYIVPTDAPTPVLDKAEFMKKAISMELIQLYARSIQAKHALFLFDSCFSGEIFDIGRGIPNVISHKTSEPVRQFIAAGGADETVPDKSIFKRQLIEGLHGEADLIKDGYVTGTELGEFLQNKVANYSRGAQNPQYGKIRDPYLDKGDFVFVLKSKPVETVIQPKPIKPSIALKPRYGSLEIYIDISGANIYLDREYQGAIEKGYTFEISNLLVGSHTIRIIHEKYKDYETAIKIYKDKVEKLEPKLEPKDPSVQKKKTGLDPNYMERAEELRTRKSEWQSWQSKMNLDFNDAEKADKDPAYVSEKKKNAWQKFLKKYKENNPFSSDDDKLKQRAKDRLRYWKSLQKKILKNNIILFFTQDDYNNDSYISLSYTRLLSNYFGINFEGGFALDRESYEYQSYDYIIQERPLGLWWFGALGLSLNIKPIPIRVIINVGYHYMNSWYYRWYLYGGEEEGTANRSTFFVNSHILLQISKHIGLSATIGISFDDAHAYYGVGIPFYF